MKIFYVFLISVALISFAQAGPFGLKSGMTIDEIIDAGFEFDKEKAESITGIKITDPKDSQKLKSLKEGKIKYDDKLEVWIYNLTNTKYPNMVFFMLMSKLVGLTDFAVSIHGENKKTLSTGAAKKLCDSYKETLKKSYGVPFDHNLNNGLALSGWYGRFKTPVRQVSHISLYAYDFEIDEPADTRTRDVNVAINYMFVASDLHEEKLKLFEEKKLQEEIKNLTPNEDDL